MNSSYIHTHTSTLWHKHEHCWINFQKIPFSVYRYLIDWIEKMLWTMLIIETHKDKRMKRSQTFTPNGFNNKLNGLFYEKTFLTMILGQNWSRTIKKKKAIQKKYFYLSYASFHLYIHTHTYIFYSQTYTSEFQSHWVPYLYGLVSDMFSDESNKLKTYTYIKVK